MRFNALAIAAVITLPFAGIAKADTTEAFSVQTAQLVATPAEGFGMYEIRPSNHYKKGETVFFYIEPKNFKYAEHENLFTFGFKMDLYLINNGDVVFGKENLMDKTFVSHIPNKEVKLDGNLNMSGAPPGNYIIKAIVHDRIGTETTEVKLPFTID